jgi:alpha-L-rhamnosidase
MLLPSAIALLLLTQTGSTQAAVPGQTSDGPANVAAVELRVDGREGELLGIDNTQPTLGWQMVETPNASDHRCYRANDNYPCPGDQQTAYQIQVADSSVGFDGGELLWDSGKVESAYQTAIPYEGEELQSRQRVVWRVRVWDVDGRTSEWSEPSSWEMGLLAQSDWGGARWIEHAGRAPEQPLPIFARSFEVDNGKAVEKARLYLSGVGLHLATVNGQSLTDEVFAPGDSNYQLSNEYRTYDLEPVLQAGENVIGVKLGHSTAYVRRSLTNPAVGRTSPYSWWQSQLKGSGVLVADVPAGATNVLVSSVSNYHVGGTINIDTGDGGDRLESRVITAIGTAGADGTGISFDPPLESAHAVGAQVTGSGNNIAATDPSAGAAVTPRVIGRLEISYTDGTTDVIVTDRSWRSALGPHVTDAWFSGSDFDARRVQEGWDEPGADLSASATRRDGSPVGWQSAGIAPPPNLATKLVARPAEGVVIVDEFKPKAITNPQPGVWVFDFGQNFAGVPQLRLDGPVPPGVTVRMHPAESLNADGTVNQASIGVGGRGAHVFNSYTTYGDPNGETWRPDFNYFGMQWVQVDGLPEGYVPDKDTITGLQTMAGVPVAGTVTTSNERINRIHKMARYSIMSNMLSTFTDCPGREKLSYPADYTMPMGMIHRNFELDAYMRTTMHHLVEGQSIADTFMRGNVALKTPVFDWGYTGRFGDEINWGNAIILVPWFLYEYYGDTQTMSRYYDQMTEFVNYIRREKTGSGPTEHIVDAALADWVAAENTSGEITGTWGYYVMIDRMAKMAALTGHDADAAEYEQLAEDIKDAFNARFYNDVLGRYTSTGNAGTAGATQAAQALALDAGLVPDDERERVLDALVELVYSFQPFGGGPHFSAGTIGMAPVVRVLMDAGRDDVLWDLLQEDTQPSYGYFMEPTTANPEGFTTIGERWTRGSSKNHIILAQIDEWFHAGLAGIRKAEGSIAYRELVIQPKIVGDLTSVEGSYTTPQGMVSSSWTLDDGRFELAVRIPSNTTAEIWVPTEGDHAVSTPAGASFVRIDGDYAVYEVGSGSYRFVALDESWADLTDSLSKLAEAGAVSADDYASLQEQIAVALATATDSRPAAAANQLEAFVRAADQQVEGEGNEEEKARLLAIANSLATELNQTEEKRIPS